MGATTSKQSGEEKMAQLDRSTLNRIEASRPQSSEEKRAAESGSTAQASLSSPLTLPRQQYLDSSIQAKIREELSRLRRQEAEVQSQIDKALEKENLDKAGQSASQGAKGKSSILLRQELEDVRSKIERHQQRRAKVDKAPGVQQTRSKLLECYKCVPYQRCHWTRLADCFSLPYFYSKHTGQTLECWAEVKDFKEAVARAESVRAIWASRVRLLHIHS